MPETPESLPDFVNWSSFPFEGDFRVKKLQDPVAVEPPRTGEDANECVKCNASDEAYIWVSERWRVRSMDQPTGLPMVLILESRSHLDLGDLTNLLAAELGVMTVRLEKAIRSLDGVSRVHVNRWGDGSAHLHVWFLARPRGWLQLRGTFLSMWDSILPPVPEPQWRENLALVAAWLAEFGGTAIAEPPHIEWKAPATVAQIRAAGMLDETAGDTASSDPIPGSPHEAGATQPSGGPDGVEAPEPAAASRKEPGADGPDGGAAPPVDTAEPAEHRTTAATPGHDGEQEEGVGPSGDAGDGGTGPAGAGAQGDDDHAATGGAGAPAQRPDNPSEKAGASAPQAA